MAEQPPILRPIPRRTFEVTPASNESSVPPSPSPEHTNLDLLDAKPHGTSPSRTRSILNLTSSTLLGIYSPTGYEVSREEPTTPWGTGAQTPSQRQNFDDRTLPPPSSVFWERSLPRATFDRPREGFKGYYLPLLLRGVLLFLFGVAYGTIITQLHNTQKVAPVKVDGINRGRNYLLLWGFGGVALGSLLPWVDSIWEDSVNVDPIVGSQRRRRASTVGSGGLEDDRPTSRGGDSGLGADWNPAVRSIGAFVGIAFAIRKLPWQSTLQVSLTLALANPALWYLIDRSKTGFLLSTSVGVLGTMVLLGINPDIVPSPAITSSAVPAVNQTLYDTGLGNYITDETIGVWTWIASVLFCSCVCFGNIGRRLALGRSGRA